VKDRYPMYKPTFLRMCGLNTRLDNLLFQSDLVIEEYPPVHLSEDTHTDFQSKETGGHSDLPSSCSHHLPNPNLLGA